MIRTTYAVYSDHLTASSSSNSEEVKTKNYSGNMSNSFKGNTQLSGKNEVGTADEEDDLHYLTGKKPFFDVIITKRHIAPYYFMYLPADAIPWLPQATIPVVLSHGGKNWDMSYNGNLKAPRFDSRWWKIFVEDNNLKYGDACVFELMEKSETGLRFKVVILRNDGADDLPPEVKAAISRGKKPETAININ